MGLSYGANIRGYDCKGFNAHLRGFLCGAVIRWDNQKQNKSKNFSTAKVRIILYKTIPLYKKVQKNLHLFRKCLKINKKKIDISLHRYKTKNKAFKCRFYALSRIDPYKTTKAQEKSP